MSDILQRLEVAAPHMIDCLDLGAKSQETFDLLTLANE
jgi:hypothetical protein